MRKIAVLDKNTIDKIAAGEVVERPASVVKELVENAIDAQSSAITVEIKEGGTTFMRITDNGAGIPKEEVPIAFMRHATSKIEQLEDLCTISSLGFRGEALSSIAAVSQVELITKTPEDFTGMRYIIEGGVEKLNEEIGAPNGTTFLVRNLFFNTPVRAKFLKNPPTEAGYITSFIEQLALSHPQVSFHYIVNGQTKLHTSGNGQRKDIIYQIYGRDITKGLVEVDYEAFGITLTGFIGKPMITRGNRSFENYDVNNRYIKSKIITRAIEEAYKGFMMQHKYPFTSLSLQIDPNVVDVNVHPTKMEVRFSEQKMVYDVVYQGVRNALTHIDLIPEVSFEQPLKAKKEEIPKISKQERIQIPEPFEKSPEKISNNPFAKPKFMTEEYDTKVAPEESVIPVVAEEKAVCEEPTPVLREKTIYGEQQSFLEEIKKDNPKSNYRIIGQLFDTYWLLEYEEKLFIIDQHAAHEKVLYERFMARIQSQDVNSQMISPPMIVTLSAQEAEILEENRESFEKLGFEWSSFGGNEYSISALPEQISSFRKDLIFTEMLDALSDLHTNVAVNLIADQVATMACKAAVKGNHSLSIREIESLIDELLTLKNPYHCPHGRPTIISMTKYELEKKFKRVVT